MDKKNPKGNKCTGNKKKLEKIIDSNLEMKYFP